ncbi:MAG: hypothetical protein ABIA74_05820 [bacterium]
MSQWKIICNESFDPKSKIIISDVTTKEAFFILESIDNNKMFYMFYANSPISSKIQVGWENIVYVECVKEDKDNFFWNLYVNCFYEGEEESHKKFKVESNLNSFRGTETFDPAKTEIENIFVQASESKKSEILDFLTRSNDSYKVEKIFYKTSDEDDSQYESVFALIGDLVNGFFIYKWIK